MCWCYIISIDDLIESTGSVRQTVEVKKRCRWSEMFLLIPRQHHCLTVFTWNLVGKREVRRPKNMWERTVCEERDSQ